MLGSLGGSWDWGWGSGAALASSGEGEEGGEIGGANIPSQVAMADEHWSTGPEEVVLVTTVSSTSSVIVDDVLRMRGAKSLSLQRGELGDPGV